MGAEMCIRDRERERTLIQHKIQRQSPIHLQDEMRRAMKDADKGLYLVVACLFPHAVKGIYGPNRKLQAVLSVNPSAFRDVRLEGGDTLLHLAVRSCIYGCFGRANNTGYWNHKELEQVFVTLVNMAGVDPLVKNAKGELASQLAINAPHSFLYDLMETIFERNLAMAMAFHPRLGKECPLSALDVDIIKTHVVQHMCLHAPQ